MTLLFFKDSELIRSVEEWELDTGVSFLINEPGEINIVRIINDGCLFIDE